MYEFVESLAFGSGYILLHDDARSEALVQFDDEAFPRWVSLDRVTIIVEGA